MDPHHHYRPPPADPHHPPPPGQWYPPPQYTYQPPPPPQWGPPPPPHQPYRPPHHPQDWGNTNWGHHPGWEYPARQDEEDWAAKARAWAASSKTKSDTQHPQLQFTPVSRLDRQSPFHDPYQQTVEGHYADVQSSNPSPGYHHYPPPGAHSQSLIHQQEYAINSSGPSSFVLDEHVAYGAKDGRFGGDLNAFYHHQESSSISSLVHMQEVPSSYSSITGNVETGDGREKLYKSFPYPTDSSQVPFHDHLPPPPVGRSILMEQPHYGVGNHATELPVDLSDQPLSFTRRSSFDHEQMTQQNNNDNNDPGRPVRGVDPVAAAPSHYSLTSAHLSGTVYPPFPPVHPSSSQQHGSAVSLPSSFPGHSTPSFGMMSGPTFQSSIPAIGIGVTSGLHPTTVFSGDIYGVLSGSDRPKKAPVPDWLKEEIIKNKAIIASSGPERPTGSIEDDTFDKTPGKVDQEDSQSIDSPRSAVEEDDEDNMEAVKTAEVNQEIKRILTEVLLKVTDELFDEIATQVLREDFTSQVAQETVAPDCKSSFAFPALPNSKASAKVLVAAKAKEVETEDESGKSTSSSPGDLLGLASYASDNDDDDDGNSLQHQPSNKKLSEDAYAAENGNAGVKLERDNKSQVHGNNFKSDRVSNGATIHHDAIGEHKFEGSKTVETPGTLKPNNSVEEKVIKVEKNQEVCAKLQAVDDSQGGETRNKHDDKDDGIGEPRTSYVGGDIVKASDGVKDRKGGKEDESLRRHDERYEKREMTTDRNKVSKEKMKEQVGKSVDKDDGKDDGIGEPRTSYVGGDIVKANDGVKDRKGGKEDESLRRHDERYEKREMTTDKNKVSKEKMKEQVGKSVDKAKESDSKKRSSDSDDKMDRKEKERDRRANEKDDSDRRRNQKKNEKEERSRDKRRSESSRHRRRRSPSAGSRGRSSKGNSIAGHANYSSDESSDDSKRKLHTKKRNLSRSPSPSRSRKRQDSRSPPSKRSHRRHSPFSSLETTRGRRSRSRSPARRQR